MTGFEAQSEAFVAEMAAAGVRIATTENVLEQLTFLTPRPTSSPSKGVVRESGDSSMSSYSQNAASYSSSERLSRTPGMDEDQLYSTNEFHSDDDDDVCLYGDEVNVESGLGRQSRAAGRSQNQLEDDTDKPLGNTRMLSTAGADDYYGSEDFECLDD